MDGELPHDSPSVVARAAISHAGLLNELGIELDPSLPQEESFVLMEREGRLDLRPPGEHMSPGIHAVFPPDRGPATGARNPLIRAFGKKRGRILDLTAGLGGDAYRLAAAGHQVQAFERHPAIFALLATGWADDCEAGRVPASVAERLDFSYDDGVNALTQFETLGPAIYLDPMYPDTRKNKALPKRELQVLRQLLGEQSDACQLAILARSRVARVVVKRPHRAAPLMADVTFNVSTKLVRFDVYLNPESIGDAEA